MFYCLGLTRTSCLLTYIFIMKCNADIKKSNIQETKYHFKYLAKSMDIMLKLQLIGLPGGTFNTLKSLYCDGQVTKKHIYCMP